MGTLNDNGQARNQRCLGYFFQKIDGVFCTTIITIVALVLGAISVGYSQNQLQMQTNTPSVVYVGLDNPLTISVEGIPTDELIVQFEYDTLVHQGKNRYVLNWNDYIPRRAQLVIEHPPTQQRWTRRLELRPIPVRATVGLRQEGTLSAKEMQAQLGIVTQMINIGICGHCKTSCYTLHYIPAIGASQIITAKGARFTGTVQALIQQAREGDRYFFTNIRVRCPGDPFPRPVSSIFLMIK